MKRAMRCALVLSACANLALIASPRALAAEQLMNLPTRPGVMQPVWVMTPPAAPVASVILFTGGNGVLGSAHRAVLHSNNFLIRSREKFAAAGFLVASVDAPSDHADGLDTFRSSAEHATDIAAVIAYLRQRAVVPVWLIGTSKGTISAANVAARLKSGGPDGLVLTSSMVAQTRRVVPINANVDVAAITLPTLFVHNKEDACPACAFSAVPMLMDRFTNARKKALIAVSGGSPPESEPCEALSRHGYLGIEDEVVGDIVRWIKG
jgi:hypothetical protein